jgi:hypothetical protein
MIKKIGVHKGLGISREVWKNLIVKKPHLLACVGQYSPVARMVHLALSADVMHL